MPGESFDASVVKDTVEAIRASNAQAAALITRLWAEVQRLSHKDYVPPTPLTKEDFEGPFLAIPNVDVEFFDLWQADCGHATAELELKINQRGILIRTKKPVLFQAKSRVTIYGYHVWIGSDRVTKHIDKIELGGGDTYFVNFSCPIKLGRDIDHKPNKDHAPEPNPPDGQKREKIS